MRLKSDTHISDIVSAQMIFARVTSLQAEKNSASEYSVALQGRKFCTVSSVFGSISFSILRMIAYIFGSARGVFGDFYFTRANIVISA